MEEGCETQLVVVSDFSDPRVLGSYLRLEDPKASNSPGCGC